MKKNDDKATRLGDIVVPSASQSGPGDDEYDGPPLLRVVLNQPENVSMGEFGRLLGNLQVAVRATADVLDGPPSPGSVHVTGFTSGSLEFFVTAPEWLPLVTEITVDVFVDIAKVMWEERGVVVSSVGTLLAIITAARQRLERRRGLREQRLQVDRAAERHELKSGLERDIDAEELAAQHGWSVEDVRRAMQAFDAIDRSCTIVAKCEGGLFESLPSRNVLKIGESRKTNT